MSAASDDVGHEPVMAARPLPVVGFDTEDLGDAALKKGASKMTVPRLAELLFDGRTLCRVNAARALGHMGKAAHEVLRELTIALKDAQPPVRIAAAQALGRLQGDPLVVVSGLAAAVTDRDEAVQEEALSALDAYAGAAVGPILALLEHEARKAAVVGTVAARAPKLYLKPLTQALAERESPRAQENAALALARLGPGAASATKTLLAVMEASDVPVRCTVIRTIGAVAKPTADLVEALKDCAIRDERESVEGAVRRALNALKAR